MFTDIYAQLTSQFLTFESETGGVDFEVTRDTQLLLKHFGSNQILPYIVELVPEPVPIGSLAIKLLRFILQYDPDCCN